MLFNFIFRFTKQSEHWKKFLSKKGFMLSQKALSRYIIVRDTRINRVSRVSAVAECSRGGISGEPFVPRRIGGIAKGCPWLGERGNRQHVFPRYAEPRPQKPTSVPPIERFHWALCRLGSRCRLQYRRTTIYPISNHREYPLAPNDLSANLLPAPGTFHCRTFVSESTLRCIIIPLNNVILKFYFNP